MSRQVYVTAFVLAVATFGPWIGRSFHSPVAGTIGGSLIGVMTCAWIYINAKRRTGERISPGLLCLLIVAMGSPLALGIGWWLLQEERVGAGQVLLIVLAASFAFGSSCNVLSTLKRCLQSGQTWSSRYLFFALGVPFGIYCGLLIGFDVGWVAGLLFGLLGAVVYFSIFLLGIFLVRVSSGQGRRG